MASIFIGGIGYYIYTKDEKIDFLNQEDANNIIVIDNKTEMFNNEGNSIDNQLKDSIFIHISGAVNQEGIIQLETNSRVADGIEKAGGLKENADISDINLAYKLEDGMKIYIPTISEKKEIEENRNLNSDNTKEYVTENISYSDEKEKSSIDDIKVNINTATQTQLETLPGIGPSTALKIIEYRKEKGKFNSIDEIKEIKGIGESKFNKIEKYIYI